MSTSNFNMEKEYPYCCQEIENPENRWRSCQPCDEQYAWCYGNDEKTCNPKNCHFEGGVCKNKNVKFAVSTNCEGIKSGSCSKDSTSGAPDCSQRIMGTPLDNMVKDTNLTIVLQ